MPNSGLPMRFFEKPQKNSPKNRFEHTIRGSHKIRRIFYFFCYQPYLGICKSQNVLVNSSVASPKKRATVFCLGNHSQSTERQDMLTATPAIALVLAGVYPCVGLPDGRYFTGLVGILLLS